MSFYADHKQLVDQAAHFGVGFGWVAAFAALSYPDTGFATMMVAAELRELAQHDWNPINQGPGSWLDLTFFAIGGILALVVL